MYGILISLGMLIAILTAEYLVKKDKKDSEIIWDIAGITIISGIIGARIYHVIDFWGYYKSNPINILKIWHGGLGIQGGILLAIVCTYLYLKIKHCTKDTIVYIFSILAIVTPLAQAIGRWGNYFNKELYGIPTNIPFGIKVDNIYYHPLFLYESIANTILFLVLLKMKRQNKKDILLIATYLGGYGLIRFILEFLRNEKDILFVSYINIAQVISILLIVVSYILVYKDKPANDISSK